jgi:hypothetical protein
MQGRNAKIHNMTLNSADGKNEKRKKPPSPIHSIKESGLL